MFPNRRNLDKKSLFSVDFESHIDLKRGEKYGNVECSRKKSRENLITLIKYQKEENSKLSKENVELKDQVRQLEGSLLKEAKQVEQELTQERETTRQAVDDLIKSIDDLIESGG